MSLDRKVFITGIDTSVAYDKWINSSKIPPHLYRLGTVPLIPRKGDYMTSEANLKQIHRYNPTSYIYFRKKSKYVCLYASVPVICHVYDLGSCQNYLKHNQGHMRWKIWGVPEAPSHYLSHMTMNTIVYRFQQIQLEKTMLSEQGISITLLSVFALDLFTWYFESSGSVHSPHPV